MRTLSLFSAVALVAGMQPALAQSGAGGRQGRDIPSSTSLQGGPRATAPDAPWRRKCIETPNGDDKIEACRIWLSTFHLRPGARARGLMERGLALQAKGDLESAIRHLDEGLALAPERHQLWQFRGSAHLQKGDINRALADFDRSLELKPDFGPALHGRSRIHASRRDWARAVADLQILASLDNPSVEIRYDFAVALLNTGRPLDALAGFNRVVGEMKGNASFFMNRGMAFYRTGDTGRAENDFALAVQLAPQSEFAARTLAAIRAARGVVAAAPARPTPVVAARPTPGAPVPPVVAAPVEKSRVVLPASAGETRVALVFGNANYKGVAPLANPANDAEAVAAKLKQIGFTHVKLVIDASREQMLTAMQEFARQSEKAEWAMVYFAGHGMQINGTNWLIPTDAAPRSDRDLQFQGISVEQLTASVEGARRLRLVVLDACRDNPFAAQLKLTAGATRSLSRGLGRVEPSSTFVVFAAKDGEVALDGTGKHSPFAEALVRHMGTPGLEINRLFRRIASEVLQGTNNRQEPHVYGRLPDADLYFVAPPVTTQVAAPRQG